MLLLPASSGRPFQYISCYSLSIIRECYQTMHTGFNTSHVTLYPPIIIPAWNIINSFNTSHVTLYRKKKRIEKRGKLVSIHLMLLFIRCRICRRAKSVHVSIHLMLLFIIWAVWRLRYQRTVSIHLMLLFINESDRMKHMWDRFNTSHVTLYLEVHDKQKHCRTFQYISCYSLSGGLDKSAKGHTVSIHLMLLFITSVWFQTLILEWVSIHLMLLFIRYGRCRDGIRPSFQYISCYSLSAHPWCLENVNWAFQYISCYSLSEVVLATPPFKLSFNTSHVTLYRFMFFQRLCDILVSIHLMLLFIMLSMM